MDNRKTKRISMTVNALGGKSDGQVINGVYNGDWNPIWDVATSTFDGGWTVEIAIPFKSLRYTPGEAQVWGFNTLRTVRWRNELSVLAPVPPWRGMNSVRQPPSSPLCEIAMSGSMGRRDRQPEPE